MIQETFPVQYKETTFMVNPQSLCKSSRKFRELYQSNIENNKENDSFQLNIACNLFTERNIENFLKLCQNQPTDVKDCEMKEICEIAKLFEAEKIYDTGIDFVQKCIDPNFSVPDDFFDESRGKHFLYFEREPKPQHIDNMSDFESSSFSDESSESCSESSSKSNNSSKNVNKLPAHKLDGENSKSSPNVNENESQNKITYISTIRILPVVKSTIYTIHSGSRHLMKRRHFTCSKDGQIILSAKQKKKTILIEPGPIIHQHHHDHTKSYVSKIVQSSGWYNTVENNEQTFIIRYTTGFKNKQNLMNVSFLFKGTLFSWISEDPYCQNTANLYNQKLVGVYHRISLKSLKNIILRNNNNDTTFIMRKMDKGTFEVECHPDLPETIAFAIAISGIVGPYHDIETSFK